MNANISEFMNQIMNIQNATYAKYPIKRILSRADRANLKEISIKNPLKENEELTI